LKRKCDIVVHSGDFIADGRNNWEWNSQFFNPVKALLASAPLPERSELSGAVTQITSGGAGASTREKHKDADKRHPYSKLYAQAHHYCVVEIAGPAPSAPSHRKGRLSTPGPARQGRRIDGSVNVLVAHA